MKKFVFVVVGALIASLLFSGCFLMRTLSFTKDKVDPGAKTTAKVTVNGQTDADDEVPFFFTAAEDATVLTNGGEFDTEGVFSGPKKLIRDDALPAIAQDECELVLKAKGPPEGSSALRTKKPFPAHNPRKLVNARLPIRTDESSSGGTAFALFMGTWTDDGDGVVEDPVASDDEYDCQPPYISTLLLSGPLMP